MAVYVDTSAAAKLLTREPESDALRQWIAHERPVLTSSDLLRTELMRVARRLAGDESARADAILAGILILPLPPPTFDVAGRLLPAGMRSLDAIHLAAALDLGDELDGLLTYDERLADAASGLAIEVITPR